MTEKIDFKGKLVLFGFLQSLSGFIFGYTIAQFNSFFTFFMAGRFGTKYPESQYDNIISILNTVGNSGALFCSITSPFLLKYVSRLWLFYLSSIIFSVACIAQIWAPLELLYFLRFVMGYVMCFYSLFSSLVLRESVPSNFVGLFGGLFYVFIVFGVQMSYLLGFEFFNTYYYIGLFIPAVVDTIRLICFLIFLNIDSPNYIYDSLSRKYGGQKKLGQSKRNSESQALKNTSHSIPREMAELNVPRRTSVFDKRAEVTDTSNNPSTRINSLVNLDDKSGSLQVGNMESNTSTHIQSLADIEDQIEINDIEDVKDQDLSNEEIEADTKTQNQKMESPEKEPGRDSLENLEQGSPVVVLDSTTNLMIAEKKNLLNSENQHQVLIREEFFNHSGLDKYLSKFYNKSKWGNIKKSLYTEYKSREASGGNQNICKLICSKRYSKQFWLIFFLNLVNQSTGINIIIFYSTNLFRDLNIENPEIKTFIVGKYFIRSSKIHLYIVIYGEITNNQNEMKTHICIIYPKIYNRIIVFSKSL